MCWRITLHRHFLRVNILTWTLKETSCHHGWISWRANQSQAALVKLFNKKHSVWFFTHMCPSQCPRQPCHRAISFPQVEMPVFASSEETGNSWGKRSPYGVIGVPRSVVTFAWQKIQKTLSEETGTWVSFDVNLVAFLLVGCPSSAPKLIIILGVIRSLKHIGGHNWTEHSREDLEPTRWPMSSGQDGLDSQRVTVTKYRYFVLIGSTLMRVLVFNPESVLNNIFPGIDFNMNHTRGLLIPSVLYLDSNPHSSDIAPCMLWI